MDLDELVAHLPHLMGYEMTDEHMAVQLISPARQTQTLMAFTWPTDYEDRVIAADRFGANIADIAQREGSRTILVVGYGQHGRERAEAIAAATAERVPALDAPVLAHVDRDASQYSTTRLGQPWWRAPARLPDVHAEAVLAGLQAPARTREELTARVAPLPSPGFAAPSSEAVTHAGDLEPSQRAEAALRVLQLLAETPMNTPPLNHNGPASAMSTLAAMVTSDRAVRDAVLVHAAADPTRADALVRTFRAAPPQVRSTLAAVAGGALYLSGQQTVLVHAVLEHVDPTGPDVRLADLVQTAASVGLHPARVIDALQQASTEGLRAADAAWSIARTAATRAASFPGPAASTGARAAAPAAPTRPGSLPVREAGQQDVGR